MTKHVFRFFAEPASTAATATRWTLAPEDAHHALKVLRLPAGEAIEATDGRGTLVYGGLTPTGKESAEILVTQTTTVARHSIGLELALGALKPGDLDEVIPGLVELGMDRIAIFIAEQTGKNRLAEKAISRWQRIIETAVKQSKRLWLPELVTFDSLEGWLQQLPDNEVQTRWIFTEIAGNPTGKTPTNNSKTMIGLVGSECGFSEAETRSAMARGFQPVSLGPHVLRARTAAISAATMLTMAGHGGG